MVARAFLSVIPLSWKNARVVFSCSEHPLQINLFSFGLSGATSRIAVFGVGSATGGGGSTWGSVAVDVVTVARRGKATVRNCCIKFNRIRHPYRRGVYQPSREASSTALSVTSLSHNVKPAPFGSRSWHNITYLSRCQATQVRLTRIVRIEQMFFNKYLQLFIQENEKITFNLFVILCYSCRCC